MRGAQELRDVIVKKEGVISSLQAELEDLKQQHDSLVCSYDEKVCLHLLNSFEIVKLYVDVFLLYMQKMKIQKLNEALKAESDKLTKEKSDREKEVMIVNISQ